MSKTERNILIDSLAEKGITDQKVLMAMREVQREKFVQPNPKALPPPLSVRDCNEI